MKTIRTMSEDMRFLKLPNNKHSVSKTCLKCLILMLCISRQNAEAQQCNGSAITFEKISGSKLDPQQSQTQVIISGFPVLLDCINLCNRSSNCNMFNMDYQLGQCIQVDTREGRRELIKRNPSNNYFEKICLQGITTLKEICGDRLWAFDRIIGGTLQGFDDKEERDVHNRTECERLCLTEDSFVCRSAEFDSLTLTCTLSRETRRTQPQAFIIEDDATMDYLENQCSTQSVNLVGCPYETRRDTSLVATESSHLASSESECQTSCDQSRFFVCRAYTYNPVRRACYISSDDSTSFPNIITQQGTFFGERKCPEQCTAGIITYEKLTGYYLQNAQREVLTNRINGYTENCLDLCKTNEAPCPSLLIDYVNAICYKLDRTSQGRDSDLNQFQPGGLTYFEKVCLQGRTQSCNNKLWAIERVLNHEVRGYDDLVLKYVQSRHQCEEACIQETNFQCRSAEYDYTTIECKLSREDRRTKPLDFVTTSRKVDYLENQCIQTKSTEENCNYTEATINGAPMYVDAIISQVETLEDCKESCDSEETFECRSLGFRSSKQECLLSGDDIISGGRVAVTQSPDIIYSERQCEIEIDIETTTTTDVAIPTGITHPFPFTPPTQETFPEITTPPTNPAGIGRCTGGVGKTEYEKTTGYKITVELSLLHDGGGNLGISNECIIKCNVDPNCQGFILDYNTNKCYSLQNDPSLNRELLQRGQSISYFEPVCYQVSSGCGKLWTFERFYRKQLRVMPQETIQGISKVDCEQRCLKETRFACRSANYEVMKQECHLNTEDRFTQSVTLSDSTSNDYLENQCTPFGSTNPAITRMGLSYTSRQSTTTTTIATTVDRKRLHPRKSSGVCYFNNEESSSRLSYVERTLNVATEFECQSACELETSFNCKSYAFVKSPGYGSSQCYLSADTKTSLGAEMRTQTSSTYAERVCPKEFFPFPQPVPTMIPPFPPRKLLPPAPYPVPKPYPKLPLPQPPPQPFYPYPIAPSPLFPLPPPPSVPVPPSVPSSYKPYSVSYPGSYPNLGQPYPYAQPPYSGQLTPTSTSNIATVRNGQIFPLPGPIIYPGPLRCFSQLDTTFERITGLASQGYGSEVRINIQQPTLDCLRECLTFGDQCQAVTFKSNFHGYTQPPCTVFRNPSGGSLTPPTMESNAVYFQKICIAGFKCEKAWTYDRVPFFYLDGYDDLELQNINSREECETSCIQQIAFPCRSAEYFYNKRICRLSRETRRSQPYAFQHYGDGVEYLENQCHPEPGFCGFVEFPNKFLPYYDRKIYGLIDLYECQMACVRETVFNCRSISFDEKTKECFLGSCDRFCGYENVDRVYMIYSERVTCGYDLRPIPLNIPTALRLNSANNKLQQISKGSLLTKQSLVTSSCDVTTTVSYERTTGYAPLAAHNRLLPTSRVRGVTQECIKQCSELGLGCQAFVLVYFPPPSLPECLVYAQSAALKASIPESELLQNKPDVVFFEKMCLKGVKCDGKLWVFDRMFGHELKNGYFMTYEAITSRKECEDLCLKFINYPCKSALYSLTTQMCKLNLESRHTNPTNFHYVGGDIQYLENQCIT